jgi:hypothetical protein
MENMHEQENIISFRIQTLYKLEVHDLFSQNKDNCKRLMEDYHNPMKKTFTVQDAEDLMCNRLGKLNLEN